MEKAFFVDDNYQDVDSDTEQGSSFFSTIFTTRITGDDKIKLHSFLNICNKCSVQELEEHFTRAK